MCAAAFLCTCTCVSGEMAGLELPDVEWATCLLGPNTGTILWRWRLIKARGISTVR